MNIWVLNILASTAAHDLCDAHIVQAPDECSAMLSTVWQSYVRHPPRTPYNWPKNKPFMPPSLDLEHPLIRWLLQNKQNYKWFSTYAYHACIEYENRFIKRPLYMATVEILDKAPFAMPDGELQPFVQQVPKKYMHSNAVEAYRAYYANLHYATWRHTAEPEWLADYRR